MKSQTRSYRQTARAEAAEETARRIVEAFVARLMTQWYDEITLDRIAADAGVTVQTVVRRFGGKDGLLADAAHALGARIDATRGTEPGSADKVIAKLLEDYEQTGDAIVRLLALEARHPALQTILSFGRQSHRDWIGGLFARDLSTLDASARKRALDALVIVTDVYTWKLLRRDMGRSAAATQATLEQLMDGTIAQFFGRDPGGK
jgi:AcrR family transcriptional regulator